MKKTVLLAVLSGIAALLVISSCELLFPQTGTLDILAYTESADSYEDVEPYDNSGVLYITPAVSGSNYLFTGEDGSIVISDLSPGSYTVKPLYASDSYGSTINVEKGQTEKVVLRYPAYSFYYYMFNTGSTKFNAESIRLALSKALDRQGLITSLSLSDRTPAYGFIHNDLLNGTWAVGVESITESTLDADTLLADTDTFDFTVLYNDLPAHEDIFGEFKTDIEALDKIGAVSGSAQAWDDYNEAIASGSFEVARRGWAQESNKVLPLFDTIIQESGLSNTQLRSLMSQAESAFDSKDLESYESAVVEINNLLVDLSPAIPFYFY